MIHWILVMHLPCVWRHESHLQYVWQLKFGPWHSHWATRKRLDRTALPDGKFPARPRVESLGTEPDTSACPWGICSGSKPGLGAAFRAVVDVLSSLNPGQAPDQAGLAQPYIHSPSFLFLQSNYPLQHGRNTYCPPCLGFCNPTGFVSSHHFRIWSRGEFLTAQMGIMFLKLQVP